MFLKLVFLFSGSQVGTRQQLQQVVDILESEGPARGLILSTSASVLPPFLPKTRVWCPSHQGPDPGDQLLATVTRISGPGTVLLGAPLGEEGYVQGILEDKVEKIRRLTSLLPLLQDPQTEYCLLRSCLSLPKVMFSLRSVDTTNHQVVLQHYDQVTREGLARILGVPPTDMQWLQARLPVTMGGLGLRTAEEHGPAAYASSYLSALPLLRSLRHTPEDSPSVPLPPALLQRLAHLRSEETDMESLLKLEGGQHALSLEIDQVASEELKTEVAALGGVRGVRECARITCLQQPYAGSWLNVVPSPALGLHLRGSEFVPAVKLRLGMEVFSTAGSCPSSGAHSDKLGDHALCCGTDGTRISRHNALRDALHATAVAAGIGAPKEEQALPLRLQQEASRRPPPLLDRRERHRFECHSGSPPPVLDGGPGSLREEVEGSR